ncbi:MAG TPA: aldehyde ferredoxin oxidoreductase N-terminal domain-containing protein [Dehalococcoidales bacterium]|nr:aldehyde ferredoxin oxidoreductase N-terminal domain-containing protein [Dehalococcoidales bacterium]
MYGIVGKMLRINLSSSKISTFSTEPYSEHYLGGRGIASRLYWEEVPPGTKPFDAANKLIFANGPLVGTGAQAATVMAVAGVSPSAYPEGYCYGFFAGWVGSELKKAGYDGVIIEGTAAEPVYIWINDSKVEIKSAASLWGKSAYASAVAIESAHGKDVQWMTIGVSGENRVRTSVVVSSHDSTLSCGFAAVMGAKNLKAIAVKGSGEVSVADRSKLVELTRYSYHISKRIHMSIPPQVTRSGHGDLLEVIGKDGCYKCAATCQKNVYRYGKRDELTVTRRCQPMEYYLPWLYGKDSEPVDTLFDAPALADDFSLETFELENIVRWLWACQFTGALKENEVGLPLSKIGTREFLVKLLRSIAFREGFGAILAEGQLRAGEKISLTARALYSHQVNGIGQYETTPTRQYVVQSLLIPMEPRAHQPLLHATVFPVAAWRVNQANPKASPIDTAALQRVAKAFWGGEAAADVSSYEGKPLAAMKIENRTYLHDSLGLCNFTWPIDYSFSTDDNVGDPNLEGKLYEAVTGQPADRLAEYAPRIVDLQRAILLREGRKMPQADYPREYLFTEPLPKDYPAIAPGPTGPIDISGNKLDKEKYTAMLREFYKLRGWNPETGKPSSVIPSKLS